MDIRLQLNGDVQLVAHGVPLQSVTLDETSEACNNVLLFEFGFPSSRPAQHRVVEPIRMILRKQSGGEQYNLLEIPAENGVTAIIFHPALGPDLVAALKK